MTPRVGFVLQPDVVYLDLLRPLLDSDAIDVFEVAPETLWQPGDFSLNGFAREFLEIAAGRPFVAHGVGLSLATSAPGPRWDRWRRAIARTQDRFHFEWYTDHSGGHRLGGQDLLLPLPVPLTPATGGRMQSNLHDLAQLVPEVGVENAAHYFALDDPLAEPGWLAAHSPHLLLDLHNLWLNGRNLGFAPEAWLAQAPLERVIEIHVAGGVQDPMGSRIRLDSHDAPVPDPVWELLEAVLPRCPHVRLVTLERMEDSVEAADLGRLTDEVHRLKAILRTARAEPAPRPATPPMQTPPVDDATLGALADAVRAEDPAGLPEAWAARIRTHPEGFRVAAQLVARLRFDRLTSGSPAACAAFDADPEAFASRFRAYHRAVPPTGDGPDEEAARFAAWAG